jgi:hypothetical protein
MYITSGYICTLTQQSEFYLTYLRQQRTCWSILSLYYLYRTFKNSKKTLCREGYFYCPTMNSHRPKSQVTSKEQALIPEKELRRAWPRCHVSLEKSSKNHKPLEKWAKPYLSPDVTPCPANFYGKYFPRICHVVKPDPPELSAVLTRHSGWQK